MSRTKKAIEELKTALEGLDAVKWNLLAATQEARAIRELLKSAPTPTTETSPPSRSEGVKSKKISGPVEHDIPEPDASLEPGAGGPPPSENCNTGPFGPRAFADAARELLYPDEDDDESGDDWWPMLQLLKVKLALYEKACTDRDFWHAEANRMLERYRPVLDAARKLLVANVKNVAAGFAQTSWNAAMQDAGQEVMRAVRDMGQGHTANEPVEAESRPAGLDERVDHALKELYGHHLDPRRLPKSREILMGLVAAERERVLGVLQGYIDDDRAKMPGPYLYGAFELEKLFDRIRRH